MPPTTETTGVAALISALAAHFDVSDASALAQQDITRRNDAKQAIADVGAAIGQAGDDVAQAALQEAVGLGVLEAYLADDSIKAVVIDGPKRLMVDRGEGLAPAAGEFSSAAMLATIGRRLLARGGHAAESAMGTIELDNGLTATVVLPPVAAAGTLIEVRRATALSGESLVARGMLNGAVLNALSQAVAARVGIAVVGPAGGTCDILGLLAGMTADEERMVAIDAEHVSIGRSHITLTSTANVDAVNVTRQASRLHADRLLVGGLSTSDVFGIVGGAASLPGTLVGVHASGGLAALELGARLGGVPADAATGYLGSAFRVVVQVERSGGDLRVTQVAELSGGIVKSLYEWNGSDFVEENAPDFS